MAQPTPLTDGSSDQWAVDIPPLEGDTWVHVATFPTRAEAILFCKERYGSDEEGRVELVSEI